MIHAINVSSGSRTMPPDLEPRVRGLLSPHVQNGEIRETDLWIILHRNVDHVLRQKGSPPSPYNNGDRYQFTPKRVLHFAIAKGDTALVRDLILYGATINFPLSDECTPYVQYLVSGYNCQIPFPALREMLLLFLHHRADPNLSDSIYTPTCIELFSNPFRSEEERLELAEILVDHGMELRPPHGRDSLLTSTIENNAYRIAQFLVRKGILHREKSRFSPLYTVAWRSSSSEIPTREQLKFFQFSLESGVDPNIPPPNYTLSPLGNALVDGCSEMVSLLLHYGARPTQEDVERILERFPQAIEDFFKAHSEFREEMKEIINACVSQFSDSVDLPPPKGWDLFFEAPLEQRMKFLKPLLQKIVDLYEHNNEFAEFLNPFLKLIFSTHPPESSAIHSPEKRLLGPATTYLIVQTISYHIAQTLPRLPPALVHCQIPQNLYPEVFLTPPLPQELIARFYSLIKPQLDRAISPKIAARNYRKLTVNLA